MSGASVGIRDLRGDLATAVRRAEAGERIVITVGGRPAAQLGPLGGPGVAAGVASTPGSFMAPPGDPAAHHAGHPAGDPAGDPAGHPAAHPALPDLVAGGLLVAPRRRDRRLRDTDAVPVWSGTRVDRVLRDLRG